MAAPSTNNHSPISFLLLLLFSLSLSLSLFFASAQSLDGIEKDALKLIAEKMDKTNWDFNVDPCSGEGNWTVGNPMKDFESGLSCDCTFRNGKHCHIVAI